MLVRKHPVLVGGSVESEHISGPVSPRRTACRIRPGASVPRLRLVIAGSPVRAHLVGAPVHDQPSKPSLLLVDDDSHRPSPVPRARNRCPDLHHLGKLPVPLPPAASRLANLEAFLFDLDGVLTPTAEVHMRAWSRLFTSYLAAKGLDQTYTDDDYFTFIDGRPRYDGVRAFLASRGVTLPEGTPDDPPELETVCGLGNRKNRTFNDTLRDQGVTAYRGSVALLDAAAASGLRVAVVTSSRNGTAVLAAAGLSDRFGVVVDGLLSAGHGLPGKPAPDTYLHAAELLGLPAAACAVVEDAPSGIDAGRAGDFGLVIGVDRGVGAATLLARGADLVIDDLAELIPFLPAS
ncbi:HAD family hydrolase [Arthrobacter cheniae]|uniref:HAD family hydrolase n=1 Tax=Arthrobacter cheniae TaxID=1258888 RepID=A0A3A5LXU7_9MICC|nr:HAD family hydrolase [Arthrobacter cheniae]